MTQQDALSILRTGANVFLTGSPGSGKTYTVKAYIDWLRSHGIEPAITASTGVAATHIHGLTIHSWSGIGITDDFSPYELDRIAGKEQVVKRIQKTSVLIIDEISMLSGTVLDAVDAVCRLVRATDLPFGGMQVVLVGDFFQLPPVARAGRQVPFAFESLAWRSLQLITCYLTEQHRQEDDTFLSLLTSIRTGSFSEDEAELLKERFMSADGLGDDVPRLYTHNKDVDSLNDVQLAGLKGKIHVYNMESEGRPNLVEALKRGCLSPEKLSLKEGAIVMCTKNNMALGYVNGTVGKVVGFDVDSNFPLVELADGREILVSPVEWIVEEDGKPRAKITQVPLRLAWAVTVHKSQGQSLDRAAMDLSRAFEYGQGYVALSRVRTLDGLYLLGWSAGALAVHPKVVSFDEELQDSSDAAADMFNDLTENGEREVMEQNFIKASGGTIEASGVKTKTSKQNTYDETLALVKEGKSVAEIAALRSLGFGTIVEHIEKLSESGKCTLEELQALIPLELKPHMEKIQSAFAGIGYERLAPVFHELEEAHTYDELKLARAILRKSIFTPASDAIV